MKEEITSRSKAGSSARGCIALTVLGLLACCAPFASAAYVYDEAVDGDLPHPNSAFVIPFGAPNPNTIIFTIDMYSDGWIIDIGPSDTLESFTLTDFSPLNPAFTATFHMHDGPLLTDPVLGTMYASFGSELLGVDFLDHFGIGPLGEGQYLFNFWHDNTPNPSMEFDLDFQDNSSLEASTWGAIKVLHK